jgi:CRISPR/Cas system-associated exonuclease Cas4 (RecB family)
VGVRHLHEKTNLEVFGAVDDIWQNPKGELIVVDYKATSKTSPINIDATWQDSYKRQMEIYQWLLRANNFAVANTGYFVYCNGKTDRKAFDSKLEFDVHVIPYKGNDRWIEKTLGKIKKTLLSDTMPEASKSCDYCLYRETASKIE